MNNYVHGSAADFQNTIIDILDGVDIDFTYRYQNGQQFLEDQRHITFLTAPVYAVPMAPLVCECGDSCAYRIIGSGEQYFVIGPTTVGNRTRNTCHCQTRRIVCKGCAIVMLVGHRRCIMGCNQPLNFA